MANIEKLEDKRLMHAALIRHDDVLVMKYMNRPLTSTLIGIVTPDQVYIGDDMAHDYFNAQWHKACKKDIQYDERLAKAHNRGQAVSIARSGYHIPDGHYLIGVDEIPSLGHGRKAPETGVHRLLMAYCVNADLLGAHAAMVTNKHKIAEVLQKYTDAINDMAGSSLMGYYDPACLNPVPSICYSGIHPKGLKKTLDRGL